MGWQWHQLDYMQTICTSLQTDTSASTSPLSFHRPDALTATQPTVSKHWRHWNRKKNLQNFNKLKQEHDVSNKWPAGLACSWSTSWLRGTQASFTGSPTPPLICSFYTLHSKYSVVNFLCPNNLQSYHLSCRSNGIASKLSSRRHILDKDEP